MSLHNSLFFDFPVNYLASNENQNSVGVDLPEVADNKYHTFSSETYIESNLILEGSASEFTHIFFKTKNLESVIITPVSGVNFANQNLTIPEYIDNWEGNRIRTDLDGYQNTLFDLSRNTQTWTSNPQLGRLQDEDTSLNQVVNNFNLLESSIVTITLGANARIADWNLPNPRPAYIRVKGIGFDGRALEDLLVFNSGLSKSTSNRFTEITSITSWLWDRGRFDVTTTSISNESKSAAEALQFTFSPVSGQTVQIHEMMILDRVMELRANGNYTKIVSIVRDRSGIIQEDIEGGMSKAPGINNARWKRQIDYTALFKNGESYDKLIDFMTTYSNFAFAREPSRFPKEIFPSLFPSLEYQIENIGRRKTSGDRVDFQIAEM